MGKAIPIKQQKPGARPEARIEPKVRLVMGQGQMGQLLQLIQTYTIPQLPVTEAVKVINVVAGLEKQVQRALNSAGDAPAKPSE